MQYRQPDAAGVRQGIRHRRERPVDADLPGPFQSERPAGFEESTAMDSMSGTSTAVGRI